MADVMTQIGNQGYTDAQVANALTEEVGKLTSADQNLSVAQDEYKAAKNQVKTA